MLEIDNDLPISNGDNTQAFEQSEEQEGSLTNFQNINNNNEENMSYI